MQPIFLFFSCTLLLCFLPCISCLASTVANDSSCFAPDLAVLRSIAGAFPPPLFSSDRANSSCCGNWNNMVYITCSEARRVTGLQVVLQGTTVASSLFPLAICSLSALSSLSIMGGSTSLLFGPIPNCIADNLTSLVHLDLGFNTLTGPIPTTFPPSLQFLKLSSNHLTGSIPQSLSHLHSLHHLDLSSNHLTGSIPQSLSQLHSLHILDLSLNSLSGAFPAFLSNGSVFPHLEALSLYGNYALFGPIHSTFTTTTLTYLELSSNAFSGPLPAFNTPFLTYLGLASNHFSGSISPLFQSLNLTSLQYLKLSDNYLSGKVEDFNPSQFSSLYYIDLSSNSLQGPLPMSSLCGLSIIFYLGLSANSFSGQFNLQHCNLSELQTIDISGNEFTGPFPNWLGSIPKLNALLLQHNHFNGSLPSSWRNLTSLANLGLSGNSIMPENPHDPKMPEWLFGLPSLKSALLISSMQLQGKDLGFCASRRRGPALQYLDLSNNRLTSDDLPCFSSSNVSVSRSLNLAGNPLNLDLSKSNAVSILPLSNSSLVTLDLGSCSLTGSLTSLFFDRLAQSSIFSLSLARNSLEGQIPADLGNMSNLHSLDLSSNFFTGFTPLTSRKFLTLNLFLSTNLLTGNLSSLLSNIIINTSFCDGFVGELDLSHNHLTGVIPSFLGRCLSSTARKLRLNHNHLESFIPNELFASSGESLEILSLSNNQLSGPIPSSFSNLRGLVLLNLGHNRLEGTMESISLFSHASSLHYAHLRVLDLGNNRFNGTVPTTLGDIAPALQVIDFSNNYLTGVIPVESLESLLQFRIENQLQVLDISKGTLYEEMNIIVKGNEEKFQYVLQALTSLDLSSNKLRGEMGRGMGELSGLTYLNVSRNSLSGKIPDDIGKLGKQLESLDLSYNELVGSIPTSFQNLTRLAVFNVSYNKGLSGPIPQNSPQLQDDKSYLGDSGLCGQPIRVRACPDQLIAPPPLDSISLHGRSRFAAWLDEWIELPGLALGIVVGFCSCLWAIKAFALFSPGSALDRLFFKINFWA